MGNHEFTVEERRALGLYAVAGRDVSDFLDMLTEPETTIASLEVLKLMLDTPNPNSDGELNRLLGPIVTRRLEKMQKEAEPPVTAAQRIMDPDE